MRESGARPAAYFADEPDTTFGMLSARCRKQITRAGMAVLTERAEQTGRAIGDSEPKDVKRFEIEKQEPWTREAGVWRYDDC